MKNTYIRIIINIYIMNNKVWKLSSADALKSSRDALMIAGSTLAFQLLEIASVTDFWDYSLVATVVIAALTPLLNRLLRNKTT